MHECKKFLLGSGVSDIWTTIPKQAWCDWCHFRVKPPALLQLCSQDQSGNYERNYKLSPLQIYSHQPKPKPNAYQKPQLCLDIYFTLFRSTLLLPPPFCLHPSASTLLPTQGRALPTTLLGTHTFEEEGGSDEPPTYRTGQVRLKTLNLTKIQKPSWSL